MKVIYVLASTLLISACQHSRSLPKERPQTIDNQALETWADSLEKRLIKLPLSGQSYTKPWLSGFWPDNAGGISRRWRRQNLIEQIRYRSPRLTELKTMTTEEIEKLSPAEKYDIWQGRYDYPTVKKARSESSPFLPAWAGLCEGVAATSLSLPEPRPLKVINPQGLTVSFGSSDTKALLAYYHSRIKVFQSKDLGTRCEQVEPENPSPACADIGPEIFHLVLANRLGRQKLAFAADLTWDHMIWNHVIAEYKTIVTENSATPTGDWPEKAVKAVKLRTSIWFNSLNIADSAQPINWEKGRSHLPLSYSLYLDKSGNIIGGKWYSYERPDFLWLPKLAPVSGYYKNLEQLLPSSDSKVLTSSLKLEPRGRP